MDNYSIGHQRIPSIKDSIRQINEILNHWTNVWKDGIPPFSPLPDESVRLLKNQLEILKKCLAESEEVRKQELKLAGLEEFIIPREIKLIHPEPKWSEPILLKPILLEPTWFEPKLLKTKPQKKSDGWRQANKNQRKPVSRY
jgi:hypothetical protein